MWLCNAFMFFNGAAHRTFFVAGYAVPRGVKEKKNEVVHRGCIPVAGTVATRCGVANKTIFTSENFSPGFP
jgi:hypothetical protein